MVNPGDQQQQHLNIELERREDSDTVILSPNGDIDLSRSPELRSQLASIQKDRPPSRLVVNLESVPYMDSSGVATLVEAMQVSRKRGGQIVLCNMQDRVRSIFEIARLDMVFRIVPTLEDALNS